MKTTLPEPNQQLLELSNKLKLLIQQRIVQSPLSFEEFMHMCLYYEGLGYYASNLEIFGRGGDFITAPELGPHFAQAFSSHINAMRELLGNYSIIEVGAGSGQFAVDLLLALEQKNCLPSSYLILETSKSLQKRQQEFIDKKLSHLKTEIQWIDSQQRHPVECGVVIANEVLDALPVRLVSIRNGEIHERQVSMGGQQDFVFIEKPAQGEFEEIVKERLPDWLFKSSGVEYKTEINTQIDDFVSNIATFVNKGVFFYTDYGYPRHEYYHEQRSTGTLISHFQHIAHDDPLVWPGIQDITASVDFTALAEAAIKAGLGVDCYTTQAHFLMASHLLEELQDDLLSTQQIKKLLLPGEMGERFQTMVLSKNIDLAGIELSMRDLRHRL